MGNEVVYDLDSYNWSIHVWEADLESIFGRFTFRPFLWWYLRGFLHQLIRIFNSGYNFLSISANVHFLPPRSHLFLRHFPAVGGHNPSNKAGKLCFRNSRSSDLNCLCRPYLSIRSTRTSKKLETELGISHANLGAPKIQSSSPLRESFHSLDHRNHDPPPLQWLFACSWEHIELDMGLALFEPCDTTCKQ